MQGYERQESASNASRLITFCGNRSRLGRLDFGELFA